MVPKAGSLVAYALKITDLDPLEFDPPLFERFLNPERVSMLTSRRWVTSVWRNATVIEARHRTCTRRDAVSQITFGTMAAKPLHRDVGRVLGIRTVCRSYLEAGAARSGHDAGKSLWRNRNCRKLRRRMKRSRALIIMARKA